MHKISTKSIKSQVKRKKVISGLFWTAVLGVAVGVVVKQTLKGKVKKRKK